MNVLLIYPPFLLPGDSPSSKTGAVLPPLGLLSIAAYLREQCPEVGVSMLDSPAYKLNFESFEKKLKEFSPDVVGMSVYTMTLSTAIEAARIVKNLFPRCRVVVGGSHASVLPEECLLSPYVDVAVLGEGERVFAELIKCLRLKGRIADVANIAYKEDGSVRYTKKMSAPLNLDDLPLPARDLVDMKLYHPAEGSYRRLPATNMVTSRGCPFSCSFCSKEIFGGQFRAQSPARILHEIGALYDQFNIREVIFNDDVFTLDKKRTESLCDLLQQRRREFSWCCSTRVNLVDQHLLDTMRRSGCFSIGYGIEVGDAVVQEKIQKGFSFQQARDAVRWTKQAGIEVRAFFILGYPGETKETIQRTIDFSLELDADFVIYNLAIPLPGTAIYDEVKQKSLLLYDDTAWYDKTDGAHPLVKLEGVTASEMVEIYRSAFKRYYMRPKYFLNQCRRIRSLDDVYRYARGFFSFMKWN